MSDQSWNIFEDLKAKKVHQSTVNTLMGICAFRWEMFAKHGPCPPGVAAHVGTGVHKAAERNYGQKIESHEDMAASDIQEIAIDGYRARLKDEGVLMVGEEKESKVETLQKGEDRVRAFSTCYAVDLAPKVQPALVEEAFAVPIKDSEGNDIVNLAGRIDLVDDQDVLLDMKTTGSKKNQQEVDNSDQLISYSFVYEKLFGEPPAGVGLDCLVCTAKTMKTYAQDRMLAAWVSGERDGIVRRYNSYLQRVLYVLEMMRTGMFPPNPQSPLCSEKFCGWWSVCPWPYR